MASSSTRKLCGIGNDCKQVGTFKCEGCFQAFCSQHVTDHRRLLGEDMIVITMEHDHLRETLTRQVAISDSNKLIKQVDDWEQESISKIRQKAKEIRQELLHLSTSHMDHLSTKLRHLSKQLTEGQKNDDFVETDIRRWRETLDFLKSSFGSRLEITMNQNDGIPLVQDIPVNCLKVTSELFDETSDNYVRIEKNGQVAVHDQSGSTYTEIRGKNEYLSGYHKIRLCIEQSNNYWTFLGINSKSVALQEKPYTSNAICGWSSDNCSWLNGKCTRHDSEPRIYMCTNDIISLFFDCEAHTISMFNERSKTKHDLQVNVDNCPLPWQLSVFMKEPHCRVRILSA